MYRAKNAKQDVESVRMDSAKRKRRLTRVVAASVRHMCELLEGRLMLSKATIVDAGDFYWYQNTQIALHRATDQVVVGYMPASEKRMTRLNNGLIAKGGALAGYEVDQRLNDNSFSFKRMARGFSPTFQSLQANIRDLPAMKYFAPTFFSTAAPGRSALTDEFSVNLVDNVDAEAFFGTQYPMHAPASIGVNNWNVTLEHGGGLDVLTAANQLHGNPQVEYSEPEFISEIVASSRPPDDFYWYQNTQIPLYRATDQVVVGYIPAGEKRMMRLNNGLIASGGALEGYGIDQRLNFNAFSFKRAGRDFSPTFQSLQADIQNLPAMKYFAPTFFSPEATGRIAVTDEIEVQFKAGVDGRHFFGTEYSNVRDGPFGSNNNDYLASLAAGGGLDVLALAERLHGNPKVEYATPNFVFEIVYSG
jgi:hypothetical protein